MTRRECALGIDLGSSGPKAAVVTIDGEVLGHGQGEVDTWHLPGGGAEQDANQMWSAVGQAILEALSQVDLDDNQIAVILCSSQFSSLVSVDADGFPTGPSLLWQDGRGAKKILKDIPEFPRVADTPAALLRWLRVVGVPPVGNSSLGHARYLKYGQPDQYRRSVALLEPMDFIASRLTGRTTANQCTAWPFLLTDNRRHSVTEYDQKLVRASLLDAEKLPELLPIDSIIGTLLPKIAAELGLPADTPVATGINDTHAGALGTGSFSGTHAGLHVGSTSALVAHLGKKRTDPFNFLFSMPSPVPGMHCVAAENGMGGAALEKILMNLIYHDDSFGQLSPDDRYVALQEAVEKTAVGSDGLLFLPWLGGSFAPREDSLVRGGFLNINLSTTRAHMARSVLEGVALNMRWLRGPVEKFVGHKFSHYMFYGGGAESAAWCQIMADCLGRPVHQLDQPTHATCIGNALLGFQRIGKLDFDEIAARIRVRDVFNPIPANVRVYDGLYEQFIKAYKANRPIFHALNKGDHK